MKESNQELPKKAPRLLSLDALRGFDMLWIVGGAQIITAVAKATDWNWANVMKAQLTHAKWHGFTAYDLIFPLFMFLAGVSIPYAILSKLEKGVKKRSLVWKIVRRTILLILFGCIYNGVLKNFNNPRFVSVLGQIGVGYCIAAMVCLFGRNIKTVVLAFLLVSLAVTAAHLCIPVPEYGANVLTKDGSMNAYLDQLLVPGRLHRKVYDPQGVLCMFSAAGVTLLGVLTGFLLRGKNLNGYKKTGIMAGAGTLLVLTALLINPYYPVNKEIWTTTFNLLTGGISLLLLALFYLVIDVWKFARWSFVFQVIGVNSILIYMGAKLFSFKQLSQFLFGGVANLCGDYKLVILAVGVLLLEWLVLYFFYKRKIFLKV
jgi:predicted acyltransferase